MRLMTDVTQLLSALERGDPHAASRLLPLVYEELRKLAAQRLAREQPGQTLQTTAFGPRGVLRQGPAAWSGTSVVRDRKDSWVALRGGARPRSLPRWGW
jgi:hypothetical protein